MSVRSTAAAWMLCAAVSSTTGSTALAQGLDPLPIAGRRLVQHYTDAVDPSFTRLATPWSLGKVPAALRLYVALGPAPALCDGVPAEP